MATGTYTVTNNLTNFTYYTAPYTVGSQITSNVKIRLRSIYTRFLTTGTFTGNVVVCNSAGTVVFVGPSRTFAVSSTAAFHDIDLGAPYTLEAGTAYRVGVSYSGAAAPALGDGNTLTPTTVASSPAYANITFGSAYATSGLNTALTTTTQYQLVGGISFDPPNSTPTAPTVSSNTPVIIGNPLTVNWTHNDPNGDQQVKYQIRYRKKDS